MSTDVMYPDGGRLEIWHRGKMLEHAASVDFELLPLLRRLGRWCPSLAHEKMVSSPRSYHQCVDQFGKHSQVNLSLHRVVFALSNLNPDQQVQLIENFSMLWQVHQDLPKIKFLNGFFMDCRFCNLTAKMSDRTIQRREKSGKIVSIEYAFPNELVRPVEVNGWNLSEQEAAVYKKQLEEKARLAGSTTPTVMPIVSTTPMIPTFPEPPKETVFDQMLKKYRAGGYDKPEVTKTEPSVELGSEGGKTVERLGEEFNPDKVV